MTSKLDKMERSQGDRRRNLAFHKDFWPGIVLYVALLVAALVWGDLDGAGKGRFVWALLPVIGGVWVSWAVVRYLRRADEYERLQQLQGLAIGFCVAMLAAMTLGFLDFAGLHLQGGYFWVYLAGMLSWAISRAFTERA